MYGTVAARAKKPPIRYGDHGSHDWMWKEAPCSWRGKIDIKFVNVSIRQLEPAGSWKHPAVVSMWRRIMRTGRTVPPLIVCATERGTFYIRDGNHRYEAMRELLTGNPDAPVRVAQVVPRPGYRFRYRWFGGYGTYVLEPVPATTGDHSSRRADRARPVSPLGRTLVLVAHSDDETGGCAGLLQRASEPVVLFATDGAPMDQYFWRQYGSPQNYACVRRQEAAAALAVAGVHRVEFLSGYSNRDLFRDQRLYCAVPELFETVEEMIRRYRPEAMLVPAYEGGHPDHDVCSFIGSLVRSQLRLRVWEMPLYHRSETGALVCQRFRQMDGNEMAMILTPGEIRTRAAMVACYRSQGDLSQFVASPVEYLRPQRDYDYSRRPHLGTVNYEAWQWPISPGEVCSQFREYICALDLPGPSPSLAAPPTPAMAEHAAAAGLQ